MYIGPSSVLFRSLVRICELYLLHFALLLELRYSQWHIFHLSAKGFRFYVVLLSRTHIFLLPKCWGTLAFHLSAWPLITKQSQIELLKGFHAQLNRIFHQFCDNRQVPVTITYLSLLFYEEDAENDIPNNFRENGAIGITYPHGPHTKKIRETLAWYELENNQKFAPLFGNQSLFGGNDTNDIDW